MAHRALSKKQIAELGILEYEWLQAVETEQAIHDAEARELFVEANGYEPDSLQEVDDWYNGFKPNEGDLMV